jgi:hypothetical protein
MNAHVWQGKSRRTVRASALREKWLGEAFPRSASRLRYGSLRSPSLRREAERPPQSVTHAVITKCYLCGAQIPSLALPFPAVTDALLNKSVRHCL